MSDHGKVMVKMKNLLGKNMTPEGYKVLSGILNGIEDVWELPTSSGGRYHKRFKDGSIPSNAVHTYDMVFAACKIMRLFNANPRSSEGDMLLMGVVLHDCVKYGLKPGSHTASNHDSIAGDLVRTHSEPLKKCLGARRLIILECMVRFHSGIWSKDNEPGFPQMVFQSPEVMFIHMLDMMSTADIIYVHE